jgi:tetratricopeptide (TPR) repeat protein
MLGLTLYLMGEHEDALRHLDHMLEHYAAPSDGSHLARYQYDQKVAARSYKSVILWLRGLPDQAVRLAESNIDEADAIDHAPSVFLAIMVGACNVSALGGDIELSQRFMQRAPKSPITLTWTDWVGCLRGVLLIEQGDSDGPRRLREALKERPPTLHYSWYLGVLARGLLDQGELGEARETVRQALDRAEQRKEHWCTPELLRIEAEVLAAGGKPQEAEAGFRQSLALAQEQGALSWSLRTATSLARLLNEQGHGSDAIACLEPVFRRFTEGFDTADLIAAKRLLDELGHRVARRP